MNNQSYISDEITHFVGRAMANDEERYKLLRKILREHWLQASHRPELGSGVTMLSDSRQPLSTNKMIKCRMLCFCDIPLSQLDIHRRKYGSFGIAFPKWELLRRGANPVDYVASDARTVDILPQTAGQQFDDLNADLQRVRLELERYVVRLEGPPRFLSSLSPPGTSEGHALLGHFAGLQGKIESLFFAQLKFFAAGLPEDHAENYYMEREWRLRDGLSFRPEQIARLILPTAYAVRLRQDLPEYSGVPVHEV